MTYWIGLSGSIGSGKSTVASCFANLGVPTLSADEISHTLTAPGGEALPQIRAYCGQELFSADGSLDRELLRNWVFADSKNRTILETILHPLIWQKLHQAKQKIDNTVPYGIIEIPLLAEKPEFQKLVHRILIVEAPLTCRLKRVQQRSGLTEKLTRAIMAQQADDINRKSIADDILSNDGNWEHLHQQVMHLHSIYNALTPAKS